MNMKIAYGALVLVLVLGGLLYVFSTREAQAPVVGGGVDHKSIAYLVDGESILLGTAGTSYFGNEFKKDLDGDGVEDIVFLITRDPGGSGTFLHLVGAVKRGEVYVGTDAVLLGDRVAPQPTTSGPGRQVIANYADRGPGEPMTADPSYGKSLYLLLDPTTLRWSVIDHDDGVLQ